MCDTGFISASTILRAEGLSAHPQNVFLISSVSFDTLQIFNGPAPLSLAPFAGGEFVVGVSGFYRTKNRLALLNFLK